MKGGKQTKKKQIGIIVCMLLLLPMPSSAESVNLNDDVEIVISAGFFGKDIGRDVTIDMINNSFSGIHFNRIKSANFYTFPASGTFLTTNISCFTAGKIMFFQYFRMKKQMQI